MAKVLLFAALREAAGLSEDVIEARTVGELVDEAARRYGSEFSRAIEFTRIAVNGEPVDSKERDHTSLNSDDTVAFLPPVSGGECFDSIVG